MEPLQSSMNKAGELAALGVAPASENRAAEIGAT